MNGLTLDRIQINIALKYLKSKLIVDCEYMEVSEIHEVVLAIDYFERLLNSSSSN